MVNRAAAAFIPAIAIMLAACSGGAPARSSESLGTGGSPPAPAGGCVVGVSWDTQSVGRWAMWDEPAIKKALTGAGARYISSDAKSSAEAQAADVESLISQGANVLIIVANDGTAIEPVVSSAIRRGIQVIAYDRLIDDPKALFVTFDNVEVGRMQARTLLKAVPKGNYLFIKGDKADANSDFLRSGQDEIVGAAVKSGAIKNVGETYTDSWDPGLAWTETEQFLTATGNRVDAVLSENDGIAGAVISALTAHGLAGKVAVSGQDGDEASLNQVALGTQTVDIWKDARTLGKAAGDAAVELCAGVTVNKIGGTAPFTSPSGNTLNSILLKPTPVTRDNLEVVVDAGWISRDALCKDVSVGSVAACP